MGTNEIFGLGSLSGTVFEWQGSEGGVLGLDRPLGIFGKGWAIDVGSGESCLKRSGGPIPGSGGLTIGLGIGGTYVDV